MNTELKIRKKDIKKYLLTLENIAVLWKMSEKIETSSL